jgi:hypothetical protein
MSKIKMVEDFELCPCGSGKKYRDCCLKTKVRYFRDETNKAIKFNLDCDPQSTQNNESDCDHDCENCDQNSPVMILLAKDNSVIANVNIGRFSVSDLKQAVMQMGVLKARLIKALVSSTEVSGIPIEDVVPLLIVHEDENEDLSFSSTDSLDKLSTAAILSAISTLESQCLEFTLVLFHIGLSRGSESIIGLDNDDDEETE